MYQKEVVEVPVVMERVVPQVVEKVVYKEAPPRVVEKVVHQRDPSVRIRLQLCKNCQKNPINQRALNDIRVLTHQPPTFL